MQLQDLIVSDTQHPSKNAGYSDTPTNHKDYDQGGCLISAGTSAFNEVETCLSDEAGDRPGLELLKAGIIPVTRGTVMSSLQL